MRQGVCAAARGPTRKATVCPQGRDCHVRRQRPPSGWSGARTRSAQGPRLWSSCGSKEAPKEARRWLPGRCIPERRNQTDTEPRGPRSGLSRAAAASETASGDPAGPAGPGRKGRGVCTLPRPPPHAFQSAQRPRRTPARPSPACFERSVLVLLRCSPCSPLRCRCAPFSDTF